VRSTSVLRPTAVLASVFVSAFGVIGRLLCQLSYASVGASPGVNLGSNYLGLRGNVCLRMLFCFESRNSGLTRPGS
jgi:hypothetical protein